MRTPIAILASSFVLAACVSGTGTYVPSSQPVTQPVLVELPPVGVTIVQADDERLQVSTNRPAYLAVFEIVPQRGVSLVYPTSASQRRRASAGSSWLNVQWRSERSGNERYARNDRDDRVERARRGVSESQATHYVYVIASERPLRNVDRFLDDDDVRDVLGARLFRANDPWETMAELSKRFVSARQDEDWGEDVYEMDLSRPANARVARVYCPDGSVMYVRDEYIDRAWCAYRGGERRGGMPPVPRPDSVVASNGRPLWHRNDPKPEPPRVAVFRVQKPTDVGGTGRPEDRDRIGGEVRKVGGEDGVVLQGDTVKNNGGAKGNNGNHYGWEKGKGNADSVKNASDRPDVGRGNAKWKLGAPAASPIPGTRVKENPERPAAQPQDQGKKPDDQGRKADGGDRKADTSTPAQAEKKPEGPRKRPVVERDSTEKKDKP